MIMSLNVHFIHVTNHASHSYHHFICCTGSGFNYNPLPVCVAYALDKVTIWYNLPIVPGSSVWARILMCKVVNKYFTDITQVVASMIDPVIFGVP